MKRDRKNGLGDALFIFALLAALAVVAIVGMFAIGGRL